MLPPIFFTPPSGLSLALSFSIFWMDDWHVWADTKARSVANSIRSLTLFLLWLAEGEHHLGRWKFVLPPLLLFLSFMMFSRFEYPSFKAINWKTKKSIPRFLVIFVVLVFTAINYEWMPAILFLAYLLY